MKKQKNGLENDYEQGFHIMKKMGYNLGKGIGANEQGRLTPVEQIKKTTFKSREDFISFIQEEDENKKRLKEKSNNLIDNDQQIMKEIRKWKKEKNVKSAKQPPRTKEEVISQPNILSMKFVDMTHEKAQVFDNISEYRTWTFGEMTNSSVNSKKPKRGFGKMLLNKLSKIKSQIASGMQNQKLYEKKIDSLIVLQETIKTKIEECDSTILELAQLQECFQNLQEDKLVYQFSEIMYAFEKAWECSKIKFLKEKYFELFARLTNKFFTEKMKNWDINTNPLYCADEAKRVNHFLKNIIAYNNGIVEDFHLVDEDSLYLISSETIFKALINKIEEYLPKWNPQDFECIYRLVVEWSKILPHKLCHKILNKIIIPYITMKISQGQGRQSLQVWVKPWMLLPDLEFEESLWLVVRSEIMKSVMSVGSNPKDYISLYELMIHWKDKFEENEWDKIIIVKIIPKIRMILENWTINPQSINVDPLKAIIQWAKEAPYEIIVESLEIFFVKLQEYVDELKKSRCDENNIKRWVEGWKRFFPSSILDWKEVKYFFDNLT